MIPLQTAAGHPVTHVVFNANGSMVAVAQPHYGVTLLERATGRITAVCAMPRRDVLTGLTFCGDGRYLAAGSAKGVEVFDATTGAPLAHSFRPLVKALLLADTGTATIGVAKGARVEWEPDPVTNPSFRHQEYSRSAPRVVDALSPDGRLALFGGGRLAWPDQVLFDFGARRFVATLKPVEADALALKPDAAKFCPLSRRLAINDGNTLDVYDTSALDDEGADQYADALPVERDSGMKPERAVAVAPMPHVVLAPVFTLKSDKPGAEPWHPPFALLPDGRGLLVKRPRNRIQLWDAPTGTLVNEWSWQFEWVTCVAASADGLTAVVGGRFGRVLLWDLD